MTTTLSLQSLGLIMIACSLLTLVLQRQHLLNALLSLEIIVLRLFVLILSTILTNRINFFLTFIILTFGACEASVGLALLVALIRSHGNDYISNISTHKC